EFAKWLADNHMRKYHFCLVSELASWLIVAREPALTSCIEARLNIPGSRAGTSWHGSCRALVVTDIY
ncbi:5601_t:CDS:1, partial [Rhizophagus irregularis]